MQPSIQTDALSTYLNYWGAARLSCAPVEREVAEEGVRLAYATAGLAPPRRIVWCGGPLDIAHHVAAASEVHPIGRNVKAEIFDLVRSKVDILTEIFCKEVVVAATELSNHKMASAEVNDYDRCKAASASVDGVVRNAADAFLSSLSVRVRHLALRLRGGPRLLPHFNGMTVGPHDLASLGVYEYLHDDLCGQELTRPLQGMWKIAKSASWIVPHEHVCWIAERPTRLRTDDSGRLHCLDGPALRYPDGWSVYAWKGVQVPAWMIENPERIKPSTIADTFDPVLRNCMIEIMTPERFIKSGLPVRSSEDETGVLWRRLWSDRGVTVGSWTAVEVVDGTPDSNGMRKHYVLRVPSSMQTAREAVAWTYGLTDEQYAQLDLRT